MLSGCMLQPKRARQRCLHSSSTCRWPMSGFEKVSQQSDERNDDVKMETVRRFALSLAEVTETPHHEYASFRVRGKIFVTVPPKEDAIQVFVEEDDREQALALYPEWAAKLLWGGKVRGLRITLAPAPAAAVKALVGKAYDARARK